MEVLEKVGDILLSIKEKRPLIHHITNIVTINDCANIVLAIGGSPIMANDPAEVFEVAANASALVLNMGTPNMNNADAMMIAGIVANDKKIPVVFDPVGAGSTALRKSISERLLSNVRPSVIRGNMSEIRYLAGLDGSFKGVDSWEEYGDALKAGAGIESGKMTDNGKETVSGNGTEIAKSLAKKLGCIVAVTGRQDIVTDGKIVYLIENGCEALSRVTGTGCMVSSLVGTFCGAAKDYLMAAAGGVLSMGIAGQLAFSALKPGEGIGTFKVKLFDNIYNLEAKTFIKEGNVHSG